MPFPISVSGFVPIHARHRSRQELLDFVSRSLREQTVEEIVQTPTKIVFKVSTYRNVPRPGGGKWIFSPIDRGELEIVDEQRLRYRLSTARATRDVCLISLAIALPALLWPVPWQYVSLATFVLFLSAVHLNVRFRIPRWLRQRSGAGPWATPPALRKFPEAD